MSRIDELLKNAQVEWKKLGDVGEIQMCKRILKNQTKDKGDIPFYKIGTFGKTADAFISRELFEEYKEKYSYPKTGEVLISASGTIGRTVIFGGEDAYFQDSNIVWISHDGSKVLNKYLYYFYQIVKWPQSKGGTITRLYNYNLINLQIPIPSLELQAEIVRILDAFAELTAELTARDMQYRYYLEKLMSEEYLRECNEKMRDERELVVCKLKEVFDSRNGYTPSKAKQEYWQDGKIPWFRMEDIRTNGNILSDSIQHVTDVAVKGELFKEDSIILATSATIGEHALIKVPFLANQRFTCFSLKEEFRRIVNIKYVYYYFYLLDEWCKKNINVSNFASVDMDNLMLQSIPLPPLSLQEKIVKVLDKFESLTKDASGLLPQEIEARQKQYEYYRKL